MAIPVVDCFSFFLVTAIATLAAWRRWETWPVSNLEDLHTLRGSSTHAQLQAFVYEIERP